MPAESSTSEAFDCEIPLRVTAADRRELLIRLECARQVYNACLGEGLRRLRLARESRAWSAAIRLTAKGKRAAANKAARAMDAIAEAKP